jgi:hypothetical protein
MKISTTKIAYAILIPLALWTPLILISKVNDLEVDAVQKGQTLPHFQQTKNDRCVSQGSQLEQLVDSASNVIFLAPAKAAGTTLKGFARRCSGESFQKLRNNLFNNPNYTNYLTASYELPPVITSHLYSDEPAKDLFKHAADETLFIYSHRKETSRLVSAIKQVVRTFCEGGEKGKKASSHLEHTGDGCVIPESYLISDVIGKKEQEVGFGSERVLTCTMYKTIKRNSPNLLFMDYKAADAVQEVIARKYCPEVEADHKNVADVVYVGTEYHVKLSAGANTTVTLDDWLSAKRGHIELALHLKENISCQASTKRIERALDACESPIVKVDDDLIGSVDI